MVGVYPAVMGLIGIEHKTSNDLNAPKCTICLMGILSTFEKMSLEDNRIHCMQSGTFEQRECQCFATKQCEISEHLGYYPNILILCILSLI